MKETKSMICVGNYYSTVMGVAKSYNVPIVEFSQYCDEALEITLNKGLLKVVAWIISHPPSRNNDIDEIVFSLKHIDNIANRRGIVHFVLIPPVYESSRTEYMDSFVNKVLDKSLQKFTENSKSTFVVDHRRDKRFLDVKSAKYYVDFDHIT